jgi:molybdopterin-guanine dinucleotide biosynthesis protein B
VEYALNPQRVMALAGFSGSGKTTLLTALLPLLQAHGWRVNVIKHTHHALEFELPHKDTARFRAAGAGEVMVISDQRMAIFRELRDDHIPSLAEQIDRLAPADLVLLEGFKREPIPKIEVWRAANQQPLLDDGYIVAIATDTPALLPASTLPILDLNDAVAIAQFIVNYFLDPTHA